MASLDDPCSYGDHVWVRSNSRLGNAGSCADCDEEILATDKEWAALPWVGCEVGGSDHPDYRQERLDADR